MIERNLLVNGRFTGDLDNWSATDAVYLASAGNDHYGVANLSAGGLLSQDFTVVKTRSYTLHIYGISADGSTLRVTVKNSDGNTVYTDDIALTDEWAENTITIGLPAGDTYTLELENAGDNALYVDDVWIWFVPMTRAALAARVHAKLGALATGKSYNTTAAGALTEGYYTYAVDAGLYAIGAVNPETGQPDTRYVTEESLQTALDAIEREMLERLYREYSVDVDLKVGPRDEKLSQVAKAIEGLASAANGASQGRVVMRKMHYGAEDYEF